ncbi:MAG: site-specific integrase [Ginsengibacter sp.]
MKANAYLLLLTRRKKKNGKYPLKVRITHKGDYHDYKTDFDLTEDEFNGAMSNKPKKEYRVKSHDLAQLKARVDSILSDFKVFDHIKFKEAFDPEKKEESDVYSIFQSYINSLQEEERIKTATGYRTAMNSLKSFSPKLSFREIDVKFLKDYQRFMSIKGSSNTTIGIYLRSLRGIYNMAIAEGKIKKDDSYPFGNKKYVIPASRNIKKALTKEEVAKIFNYSPIPGTSLDKAKDFWLLSYFCNGINFKDIAMLKRENIDGDMIRFVREKTRLTTQGNQKTLSCHITPNVSKIIKKWGNKSKDSSYVFPILNVEDDAVKRAAKINQFIKTTNKYMAVISKEVGIEKKVTTYFSRHSAATILRNSGRSISEISEALGHSSIQVTQNYLDSFSDESKKDLAKTLDFNL